MAIIKHNFDKFANDTYIVNQLGWVVFESGGIVQNNPSASDSKPNYLRTVPPQDLMLRQEFYSPSFQLRFRSPAKSVKFKAGAFSNEEAAASAVVSLSTNNLGVTAIGSQISLPRPVHLNKVDTELSIVASTYSIINLSISGAVFNQPTQKDPLRNIVPFSLGIDSLEFEIEDGGSFPIRPIIHEYVYDWWWWFLTHGGLVPPPPPEPWSGQLAAALSLVSNAQSVVPEVKKSVLEAALKQISVASAGLKKEIKGLE